MNNWQQLERIVQLRYSNNSEIAEISQHLSNPNNIYYQFHRIPDYRKKLKVLNHQSARLTRIWNNQLERMKIKQL